MGESLYYDVCTSLILELLLFTAMRRENLQKNHPTVRWVSLGVFLWTLIALTTGTVIDPTNFKFVFCISYLMISMITLQALNQIFFRLIHLLKSSNYNTDHQEGHIDIIATTNTPPPPSYIELFPLSYQRP